MPKAKNLIATIGDWYVGESFAYIRVWGSNTTHMLPKFVPNRLVIEEISFETMAERVYKKLPEPKRRVWPNFPQNLGPLSIPTSSWATKLSNHIVSLKLGFSNKRKHDPK